MIPHRKLTKEQISTMAKHPVKKEIFLPLPKWNKHMDNNKNNLSLNALYSKLTDLLLIEDFDRFNIERRKYQPQCRCRSMDLWGIHLKDRRISDHSILYRN